MPQKLDYSAEPDVVPVPHESFGLRLGLAILAVVLTVCIIAGLFSSMLVPLIRATRD